MENATNTHFSNFGLSDISDSRRTSRHHSNSYSGNIGNIVAYDKPRKQQSEGEHLRERLRTCEKGLGKMYQMISTSKQRSKKPPTFNHTRSASVSHQYTSSPSPSPVPESHQINGYGTEFDDVFNPVPQVTMLELQASIEGLLREQDSLLSQVDDWKQITEAAKRERVLAIDEKDQLLRETHSLRVAVESAQTVLGSMEEERGVLKHQVLDLQDELVSLKRDNETAREMRALALEERSKIQQECSELQHELRVFQTERDNLYKETLRQQVLLEEVLGERERLRSDLGWLSNVKGCEGLEGKLSIKEESPIPAGKLPVQDMLEVTLSRSIPGMPWGFTFEGGRGTEFYHQDPSIVITGVANRTPAADTLRFGDRMMSFGNHDFHNVTKKEAAEAIRSCDFTTVTVEVGRTTANVKPAPQEIKIPGKKDFGFSYESRLFVTSTEEDSSSVGLLLPGDEIIQVQGKSAFNMKPSALKQILKSCKDGLALTIQHQPGLNLTSLVSTATLRARQTSSAGKPKHRGTGEDLPSLFNGTNRSNQSQQQQSTHLLSDLVQSPGTPKSSISESSAGYHSLAHSIAPSEPSNVGVGAQDSKTGQIGPERDCDATCFTSSTSLERRPIGRCSEGGPGDLGVALPGSHAHYHHLRPGPGGAASSSSNGFSRSSYRSRPADYYSPRRSTTTAAYPVRQGQGSKPRSYSMSAYKSAPSMGLDTSRPDHHPQPYSVSAAHRIATPISPTKIPATPTSTPGMAFSMSVDNLDSEPCNSALSAPSRSTSRPESHDKTRPQEVVVGHVAPPPGGRSRGHLSMSTGNMQTHV